MEFLVKLGCSLDFQLLEITLGQWYLPHQLRDYFNRIPDMATLHMYMIIRVADLHPTHPTVQLPHPTATSVILRLPTASPHQEIVVAVLAAVVP
jgi:hypothetical protein